MMLATLAMTMAAAYAEAPPTARALPRPARLIAGWISQDDYPAAALRAGAQGTVMIRFKIEPSGIVSDCTITSSGGHAALDEVACRIVQTRFRYEPARDATGARVPELRSQRIVWRLPEPPPAPEPEPEPEGEPLPRVPDL